MYKYTSYKLFINHIPTILEHLLQTLCFLHPETFIIFVVYKLQHRL